jgi:hypothetical protein
MELRPVQVFKADLTKIARSLSARLNRGSFPLDIIGLWLYFEAHCLLVGQVSWTLDSFLL